MVNRPRWLRPFAISALAALAAAILAFVGFAAFMVVIGWPTIIAAAQQDAERRYIERVMIGISRTDRSCLDWRQRGDLVWVCVKR